MTSLTTSPVSDTAQLKVFQRIATELGVGPRQVTAAVALLDEGSTVPFIARYRKEATGNLDDTQLRKLEERLLYLRELEERRTAILASIEEQGKLTDALRRCDRSSRHEANPRRHVPAVQAQASHDGRRLRARPAWNRWLMRCLPIPRSIRSRKRRSM